MENQRRHFLTAAVYAGLLIPNIFSTNSQKTTPASNEIKFNFRHVGNDYIEINGWVLLKKDLI